jgi:integrase
MRKNPVRVNELLDLVERDYEANKKRSIESVRIHVRKLRPVFGDRVATLVRKGHVEDYKAARQTDGVSPATINRELATLRRAFNLGIEEELIDKTPVFKLLEEPDPREGYYELDEFLKFQEAARAIGRKKNFDGVVVADITLFSFYSGWRLKECLNLQKDWIHEKEQIAVLPKGFSKNKKLSLPVRRGRVGNGAGSSETVTTRFLTPSTAPATCLQQNFC